MEKKSDFAYDAELSGFVSDSPFGELSVNGNKLRFKTQIIESENDSAGTVKMKNYFYCWIFNEKTEEFSDMDDCNEPSKKTK